MYQKAIQFLKECIEELRKVAWLSRREVVASTAVVGLLVLLIAAFVGLVDWALFKTMGGLFR